MITILVPNMRISVLIAVFAFFCIQSFSQGGPARETFNTVNSGSWTDIDSWDGKIYPDTNDLGKAVINFHTYHYIVLDGNFFVNNMITINIFDNSTLEITKDVIVKNQFEINVNDGGRFIVGGDVHIDAGAGGPVVGQLVIDGDVEIEGDLTGNGSVTGDGYLYVGGIIGDGITFDGNVTVVCGTKLPPSNLEAEVTFNSEYYSVILGWDFDNTLPNGFGIEQFFISRNDSVLGFVPYSSKSAEYNFIDNGLEAGSTPLYKVYAVYKDNVMSKPAIKSFENDPLPIDLLYFKAKIENGQVFLKWATATEINNDYFTIERSIDAHKWKTIAYLPGAGNSNHTRYYDYSDNNPAYGVSYYRLKQTDYDGQFEYFDPVAVQYKSKSSMDVEIINIRSKSDNLNIALNNNGFEAVLDIVDLQGRVVYQHKINNSQKMQDISVRLPRSYSGEILLVRLYSKDRSDVRKIIVN